MQVLAAVTKKNCIKLSNHKCVLVGPESVDSKDRETCYMSAKNPTVSLYHSLKKLKMPP